MLLPLALLLYFIGSLAVPVVVLAHLPKILLTYVAAKLWELFGSGDGT